VEETQTQAQGEHRHAMPLVFNRSLKDHRGHEDRSRKV
jgi:hypothetical protein